MDTLASLRSPQTLFSVVACPKQILCLYLPDWPITRRIRRQPVLRHKPVATIRVEGRRRQIAYTTEVARLQGIRVGMSLAEAKALCPNLVGIDHDAVDDRRSLEALGRWMTRFTPIISIGWATDASEIAPALFLDVTGCERLFGGMNQLVHRVKQSIARLGVPAIIAVAPTPGAAWALAFGGVKPHQIVQAGQLTLALQPLSVTALRLGDDVIAKLHHLGLTTIGQLLALPRETLTARFGPTLLLRIDQATGDRFEALVPLKYEVPVAAHMALDGPIDALETIRIVFETLLRQIVADLTRRGHGARQLDMVCRFDATSCRANVVKHIHLSRPTRDFKTLFNLVCRVTEQLDGGQEGFVWFQIKASAHERIADEQAALVEDESRVEELELDRLSERLRIRLGGAAVFRPLLVESYLPELAWKPEPACTSSPTTLAQLLADRSRPLHLLRMPEEIRVLSEPSDERVGRPRQITRRGHAYCLMLIIGPERIAGEWWRGHLKTRDYFEVEDEQGLRFWLFRVMTFVPDDSHPDGGRVRVRWFLHGRFE